MQVRVTAVKRVNTINGPQHTQYLKKPEQKATLSKSFLVS
jgi:hypothetical protein